jgi:hypothetical protein
MSNTFRNILAVISGLILGSTFNWLFLEVGGTIIPPPAGADVSTMEGLKSALPFFEPKHFLFPFLAHAVGTLTGALFATMIAKSKQRALSLIIGILFLIGGIMNVVMLPSPIWFSITDLLLAYIPMAYLGYSLGMKFKK